MQNSKQVLNRELDILRHQMKGAYIKLRYPEKKTEKHFIVEFLNPEAEALTGLTTGSAFYIGNRFHSNKGKPADINTLINQACKNNSGQKHTVVHKNSKLAYDLNITPLSETRCIIIFTINNNGEEAPQEHNLTRYQRDFADQIPEIICEVDTKEQVYFANKKALEKFGYSREQVIEGIDLKTFFRQNDHELVQKNFQAILNGEQLPSREYSLNTKTGTIHILLSTSPIIHEGEIRGVRAVMADITKRKKLEAKLFQREKNFSNLFESMKSLVIILNPEGRIIHTNNAVYQRLGYSSDSVRGLHFEELHAEINREDIRNMLIKLNAKPLDYSAKLKAENGQNIPAEGSIIKGEWSNQKVYFVVIRDLSELKIKEEKFTSIFRANPSIMAITTADGYFLDINTRFSEVTGLKKEEVIHRSYFEIGIFDNRHNITAIKPTLETEGKIKNLPVTLRGEKGTPHFCLLSAEYFTSNNQTYLLTVLNDITREHLLSQQLNLAMEAAKLAWYEFDLLNGTVNASPNKAGMLGYNPEEFSNAPYSVWTELIHPDDYEQTMEAMRDCMYRGKNFYNVDYRIKRADGSYTSFFDRGIINDYTPEGKPARMIGVVVDITERKKKEEQLRESERKYRQVIENANDVILITRNQKILYVNNRIKAFFGYERENIIGRDILYFIDEAEKANVLDYHKKRLSGKNISSIYQTKIINSEGIPVDVELNNSLIEIDGDPAILTYVRDLSERKKSAQKIRQLNQDYEKTVNNASSIIFKTELNPKGDFTNTFISDIGDKLLGLPKGYLNHSISRFLELINPADKETLLKTFRYAFRHPGENMKTEYRFTNPEGREFWLATQGRAEANPDGKTVFYGATFDISARKQYELELDKQKSFLQKIINTIPSMLGVKDKQGRYLTANRKFSDFIGMPARDILGKTDEQILTDPAEIEDHQNDDAAALESGISIASTKTITKDGETHYMQSTKVPLKNESNQYDKILFISHDISEQIENQKKLQQRTTELMLLTENTDLQIWYLKDANTYGLINKSHARFLNKSKDEVEYKKFNELFTPEFAQSYIQSNKTCFTGKKTMHFQEWNPDGHGNKRLLDIKKTPMVNATGEVEFVVCTARDITDEHNAEQQLTTALNFNKTLIDNSPMGIVVYDMSGQCILTNDAAVSMIGAPNKTTVLNQNAHKIKSWKESGLYQAFKDVLQTGESKSSTTKIVSTFKKHLWLDSRFIPIKYNNERHVMLILDDITETKNQEIDIRKNLEQQKLLSKIAFELSSLKNFNTNMDSALRLIGEYTGVSRVYIFRDSEDGKHTSNVFEWCNTGVNPEINNLQQIPYDPDITGWKTMLLEKGLIHSNDISKLPEHIRRILQPQGIKSILVLPILIFGKYQGFIGFDDISKHLYWPEKDVEFLRTISHIISNTYERKIIGDNLRESEERFKKISSNAQDGIILLNHHGRVAYWNNAAETIFGYSKHEIMGKDLHHLLVKPGDYKLFIKNMPEFVNTGTGNAIGKNIELQAYNKDRELIDIELSLSSLKIKGHWNALGIVRDITERKKSETQLKTLSKAVENASAMIVITDPQAHIQYVNKKFTEVTGYLPDEVVGKNPSMLSTRLLPDEFYQDLWNTINAGKEWQGEFINKRKNGETYYESALISSITDENGNILHFIGIKNDITHEKKAKEDLIKAKQEAETANKAKSEFLANMSHEIRTPMNAVIGFSDILSKNLKEQKNLSYINSIKSSSKTLLNLINDILDLSKIEAGQMKVEPEPTNLKNLIEEIIQIFSLKIQQKGLEIIVDIDPDIPEYLALDELRTRQIFLNVFGNAVKFTETGYIKVILERTGSKSDKTIDIVCHIEDSGIGISRENQNEIFEAFKQQSSQNTRKYGGTGLGLSITKRLLEIQGGKIELQSEPGKGSCFSLYFYELAAAEQAVTPTSTNIVDASADYQFSNEIILIVDDVPSNRYLLSSYLSEMALEIIEAENGQEAIEHARKYKPAVIFMDLRMPKMNGIEATRLIKATPETSNIPVIAVTASSMHFEDSDIQEAGFDGFLDKPVSHDEISKQLIKYLQPVQGDKASHESAKPGKAQKPIKENLASFSDRFGDLIKKTEASGSMSAISDLGNKILKFGEKTDDPYFMRTGDQLEQAAMGFDIEHINKLFAELKQLV